jgi:hypothetical protein
MLCEKQTPPKRLVEYKNLLEEESCIENFDISPGIIVEKQIQVASIGEITSD